jgi:hypothetical protein
LAHPDQTDALIAALREITLAYKAEGLREGLPLIETVLEKDADQILAHETVAGSNHLSFLPCFKGVTKRGNSAPAAAQLQVIHNGCSIPL